MTLNASPASASSSAPLASALAQDLAETLSASPGRSTQTVQRITDLFVRDASHYTSEHVAVFDDVLGLLVTRIEEHARAELAERLADLANAPPRIVRTLAQDEISVARPILVRSPQLTDLDLIDIAVSRGNDHMLAMTARRGLSAAVTDVLVERGDAAVLHGAAANRTARFSEFGFDLLVSRSREDEGLQILVGSRPDLPMDQLRELVRLATDTVRERLMATVDRRAIGMIESALERGARRATVETVSIMAEQPLAPEGDAARLHEAGQLDEAAVLDFATGARLAEATTGLALLAKLPLRLADRIFTEMQDDLLLIVAKSLGFRWETVAALQTLKIRPDGQTANLAKLKANFDGLSPLTAQRVVRFLHARDTLSERRDPGAAPVLRSVEPGPRLHA
jgi:uncharacterized protein (DUF2336 family)